MDVWPREITFPFWILKGSDSLTHSGRLERSSIREITTSWVFSGVVCFGTEPQPPISRTTIVSKTISNFLVMTEPPSLFISCNIFQRDPLPLQLGHGENL